MPMTKAQVEAKVVEIIVEELFIHQPEATEVTDEKNLINDLGADVLDLIEIFINFEEAFGIEIEWDFNEITKTNNNIYTIGILKALCVKLTGVID